MIKATARKIKNEGITGIYESLNRRARHTSIAFKLYQLGILSHDTVYGADYYEHMDRDVALQDTEQFADAVLDSYNVTSVLELGCGTGRLLYPYHERGIDVHGVDLSSVAKDISRLPADRFEIHDLTEPYTPEQKYDLVLCTEVLEHIPSEASDTLIESICRSGDMAIVTAAPPEQGGTHHVNEQPFEYWINRFEDYGMSYNATHTKKLKNEIKLNELPWISQNLLIFES
jgi:2-polyprenyl-3-methyl-5-hydroxy-6-metoxy-1,4-benzoquinol methylase